MIPEYRNRHETKMHSAIWHAPALAVKIKVKQTRFSDLQAKVRRHKQHKHLESVEEPAFSDVPWDVCRMCLRFLRRLGRREDQMNGRLVRFNGLFKGVSPRNVVRGATVKKSRRRCSSALALPTLRVREIKRKRKTKKKRGRVKKTLKVPCH